MSTLILLLLLGTQTIFAAPTEPNPQLNVPTKQESNEPSEDTRPLDEFNITEPGPKTKRDDDGFFYPYPSSLTLISGINGNFPAGQWSPTDTIFLFGFNALWPSQRAFHWESGIDILTNNTGRFYTVGQWKTKTTGRLRPFYSFGPGVWLKPEYQIATLIRWQNYFARVAAGFEWSFSQSGSIKIEGFSGLAFDMAFFAGASLGLTFGIN